MSLVNIMMPPPLKDPRAWDSWFFSHGKDHEEIAQAIQTQKSVNLPRYDLQEFDPANPDGWLQRHQLAHQDMTKQTGVPGTDLSQLDFKSEQLVRGWMYQNFTEHRDVRAVLKI